MDKQVGAGFPQFVTHQIAEAPPGPIAAKKKRCWALSDVTLRHPIKDVPEADKQQLGAWGWARLMNTQRLIIQVVYEWGWTSNSISINVESSSPPCAGSKNKAV